MMHKIPIGSITYAIKARDILRKSGYKASIERKTAEYKSGCGYAVVFEGDGQKAKELITSAGIKSGEII